MQTKLQDKNIIISENNKKDERSGIEEKQLIEEIDEKLSSYKDLKY